MGPSRAFPSRFHPSSAMARLMAAAAFALAGVLPTAATAADRTSAAPELGAAAIRAAVERARLKPEQVEEVLMGCVLPAGLGQAPARQASLGAGLSLAAGCTTVNKMCGSGMKAAMLAHDLLTAGSMDVVVAGGMESMTNAPYLMPKARAGYRMGHQQVLDHMFYDGLEDAYDKGRLMGSFAEDCAQKYAFSREAQDQFAVTSLQRAQKANKEGWFAWEITPMAIKAGKEERFVENDEQPFKANFAKIPTLKPAFRKDGTVTALTRKSGKVVWQLQTNAKVESSAAVAEGIAYFGATDGRLFAVDVDTGHVRWAFDTGGRLNAGPAPAAGPRPLAGRGRGRPGAAQRACPAARTSRGSSRARSAPAAPRSAGSRFRASWRRR